MHTVYMFTLYYEATKRFKLSIAFAIIPDSCLYVLMMAFLIPIIGKDGIWISITGNQFIGLMLLLPVVYFILARTGKGVERLLLLPEDFYTGTTLLEFEILDDTADIAAKQESLRAPIQEIVSDTDKTAIVMNCVEELVSDMRRTSDHIHVRLRDEGEKAELFIRSVGQRRELPQSISEKVIALGDDGAVSYSYVYKMNIVCITVAGKGVSAT